MVERGLALEVLTASQVDKTPYISWKRIVVFYELVAPLRQDTRSHSGFADDGVQRTY